MTLKMGQRAAIRQIARNTFDVSPFVPVDPLMTADANLASAVAAIDTRVTAAEGDIVNLVTADTGLNAAVVALDSRLDDEETATSAHETRLDTEEAATIAHDSRLDALEAAMPSKLEWTTVPASATATGTPGQVAYASGFLYVCVAADTWQRVAIATWV